MLLIKNYFKVFLNKNTLKTIVISVPKKNTKLKDFLLIERK
jgi:hypothetical protein